MWIQTSCRPACVHPPPTTNHHHHARPPPTTTTSTTHHPPLTTHHQQQQHRQQRHLRLLEPCRFKFHSSIETGESRPSFEDHPPTSYNVEPYEVLILASRASSAWPASAAPSRSCTAPSQARLHNNTNMIIMIIIIMLLIIIIMVMYILIINTETITMHPKTIITYHHHRHRSGALAPGHGLPPGAGGRRSR